MLFFKILLHSNLEKNFKFHSDFSRLSRMFANFSVKEEEQGVASFISNLLNTSLTGDAIVEQSVSWWAKLYCSTAN